MSQMVNTLGGIAVECGGTVLAARSRLFGEKQPRGDGGTPLRRRQAAGAAARYGDAYRAVGAESGGRNRADFNTMSNFSVKITRNGQTRRDPRRSRVDLLWRRRAAGR